MNIENFPNSDKAYDAYGVRLIVDKEHSEQYDETSVRNMLLDISKELTRDLGKGFSRSQLTYMRLFFLRFRIYQTSGKSGVTLSHQKSKKPEHG